MKKIFWFLLLYISLPAQTYSKTDSIMMVLNREIDNRTSYYFERENRIKALKQSLQNAHDNLTSFSINNQIFNEYKSYQYDSAYIYAIKTKELAQQIQAPSFILRAECNLLFCFMSSGLFKEAVDIAGKIDLAEVSDDLKAEFYFQCARLYSDLGSYNSTPPYSEQYYNLKATYCDSALFYLSPDSYMYENVFCFKELADPDTGKKIKMYLNLLQKHVLDEHQLAINASILGALYESLGDEENGLYYLALSAISDIRSAVTETTSKTSLARKLYVKGDIAKASRYIEIALEEANFYNARHRKMDVNSILPIIERQRLTVIKEQRDALTFYLILVSTFFILILISATVIYLQNKKLKKAKDTIQQQLKELSVFNEELNLINEKLQESNEIKDQYIIDSLYGKSEYLEKVESLLKKIDVKLHARQYDDIYKVRNEFGLKTERENIFYSFDQTFLKLFPDFLNQYNKFFPPEEQSRLGDNGGLTPELRIFALIRLGINENERIARFLNLSVNTIYKYKTKVKSKSILPNEEFEYRIMQIRKKSANKQYI